MKKLKKELVNFFRNSSFKYGFSIFIRFFFLIGALLFILLGIEASKKPKGVPREDTVKMSIFNKGSTGLSALRKLLDKTGFSVEAASEELPLNVNEKTLNHLTGSGKMERSVLVIADPGYSDLLIKKVTDIAEYGITVLIYTENVGVIEDILGKEVTKVIMKEVGTDRIYIAKDEYGIFEGAEYLVSSGGLRIINEKAGGYIKAADADGGVIAEKKVGNGKIVLCILPDTITNDMIGRYDNIRSGYNLIKHYSNGRNVYFYEFMYGIHKRYTLFYFFANREYRVIILALLALLTAAVLYKSLHFGQYIKEEKVKDNEVRYFTEQLANLLAKKQHKERIRKMLLEAGYSTMGKEIEPGDKEDMGKIKKILEDCSPEGK